MKQNFFIYRSSAGSGKTYALVLAYIKLALLGDEQVFKPNYFRHILAITFTNKAASEMKKRVLSFGRFEKRKGVGKKILFQPYTREHITFCSRGAKAVRPAFYSSAASICRPFYIYHRQVCLSNR